MGRMGSSSVKVRSKGPAAKITPGLFKSPSSGQAARFSICRVSSGRVVSVKELAGSGSATWKKRVFPSRCSGIRK